MLGSHSAEECIYLVVAEQVLTIISGFKELTRKKWGNIKNTVCQVIYCISSVVLFA